MSWVEEVSYQYREKEYFFVDLPAVFQYCLPALFQQFLWLFMLQSATNALYQLITTDVIFRGRPTTKHVLATFLGVLVLLYFYPATSVCLLLVLIGLAFIGLSGRMWCLCAGSAFLILGWCADLYPLELRVIQGPLMVVGMKVICALITRDTKIQLPVFLHYCLCPSSVVFGPIIPFDEFRAKVLQTRFSFRTRCLLRGIIGTFVAFIVANCVCQSVDWVSAEDFPPYHIRFLRAYKNALEFRMSHYFICYMSSFQMLLGAPKLASSVVDFWAIEVPVSMKSVVRSWNRPMHRFLKTHVFQKIRPLLGAAASTVVTFVSSAALHMFDTRVTVVLLGLSLVSIIESRLASHLPKSFADLWLRATTFIHLVFFGCIMTGFEEEDDGSYFHFVMERWLELGFVSFKILIAECVLCVPLELFSLLTKEKRQ